MFICVGTMDGFCGRGDFSSKDMATWLSASKDELDIVGEVNIDDNVEEDHLGDRSPFVLLCPIVECTVLSRASWVNLEVVLVNDNGVAVAEGIVVTPIHKIALMKTLGTEDVGVVILESLIHFVVDPTHRFALRRWSLRNVTIDEVGLHDYERRHLQNQEEFHANIQPCKGLRKYDTMARSTVYK